ncbi:MAG: signal peptide peptidase SppA [bacterium]|nr:MAG: signal peptide peptidase SppA [bacterium]
MARRTRLLILILFLVVFMVVVPIMAFLGFFKTDLKLEVKKKAVVVDLHGPLHEYYPHLSPDLVFGKREPTLTEIIGCIDHAAEDDRVEGLIVRAMISEAGVAKCEEIRAAIHRFRETGKLVVAFSPLLVNRHYLVACAADSIFMPPSGYLMVQGPAFSTMHIRGMLDKLGISPNIHRIGDYKSAAEFFTETRNTPEVREMMQWLLDDFHNGFITTIAEERGVEAATVRGWVDHALFSPQRALETGLIDGIRYWDQVDTMFTEGGAKLVPMRDYIRTEGIMQSSVFFQGVAVIHAQGTITMGESGFDFASGPTTGSSTVARELRRARKNDRIKAVILRVDSPGGDGLAGDMISREVELTARTKPVVVSMSDLAASGGYEIAYRADRIVALPGTITGSIGSITGKFNMRGFYDKIGLTKDEVGSGGKSLIFSDYRDFSEDEWAVVDEAHWAFYRNWIEEIARFRRMRIGEIDSIARGRVWTGAQALERGLIDEVGGLERALEIACELAEIDDPARVSVIHLPRRLTLLQSLLSGGLFDDTVAYLMHRTVFERLLDNGVRCAGPVPWMRMLHGCENGNVRLK